MDEQSMNYGEDYSYLPYHRSMKGHELTSNLRRLADEFDEIAVPPIENSYEHYCME